MDCCACVLLRVSVCDPPRGQYKPHRFFHSINSSIIFNLLYCQKVTLRLAPMRCEVMACQNVSNYIITHAVCANLPIPNLFLPLYSACEPLSTRSRLIAVFHASQITVENSFDPQALTKPFRPIHYHVERSIFRVRFGLTKACGNQLTKRPPKICALRTRQRWGFFLLQANRMLIPFLHCMMNISMKYDCYLLAAPRFISGSIHCPVPGEEDVVGLVAFLASFVLWPTLSPAIMHSSQ